MKKSRIWSSLHIFPFWSSSLIFDTPGLKSGIGGGAGLVCVVTVY